MDLADQLQPHWPPQRVIATCGVCGGEFINTDETTLAIDGYSYFASYVESLARKHRQKTGHDALHVDVHTVEPVKEIEATVTVNTT